MSADSGLVIMMTRRKRPLKKILNILKNERLELAIFNQKFAGLVDESISSIDRLNNAIDEYIQSHTIPKKGKIKAE